MPNARGPLARHGRLPRRRAWTSALGIVASVLAVALVSGTSVAAIAGGQLAAAPKTVQLSTDDQKVADTADITAMKGGANILLIGSDTRVGQFDSDEDVAGARNDVTILVHISQDHQQLTAVSFPRDLMVPIPACTNPATGTTYPAATSAQFNTALGNGGVSCVVDTVENLTGLRIPYAGLITFDGVISMSNALGGVDVCVAQPINDSYTGLHLTAGSHTLEGSDALAFLRTRHGVGDGSDLARISSQQVFLSALLRKITSGSTLSDPVTLYRLASAALHNMTLSDGLAQARSLVGLATTLRGMSTANMLFVQYPVVDDPADNARVIVAQDAAHTLNVALQTDQRTSLSDSTTGRASEESKSAGSSTGSSSSSGSSSSGTSSAGTPSGSSGSSSSATSSSGSTPSSTPTATTTPLPSTITGQSANEQTCSVGN
ncbi:LCP family protein required for cell wall assembly [Curtobacterium luteum]|uniref:LCP family protein required for cell wall assembly n=1 Tax=Curtobacterium luteum TaxID=33881 RepID=A0A8H9G9E9_9MICO|nr:LCP family protein [Curtobacterium luteum]MBM7803046.1 LCP family protein required for cell wall assembly [Curtobacterium luteum]NUU50698.1 LCP family protein [Curtobacterium luteum]GGK93470.1 transcriptional regulator [Curtobacterium luteum]